MEFAAPFYDLRFDAIITQPQAKYKTAARRTGSNLLPPLSFRLALQNELKHRPDLGHIPHRVRDKITERVPVDAKTVRAGLYNLPLHNTREDLIRAFLEGIAFNTRWLLKPVEKFLRRKVES